MNAERISLTPERTSLEFLELPDLPVRWSARLLLAFKRWRERDRSLQALAELDARMLRDIGLTDGDVYRETKSWHLFL